MFGKNKNEFLRMFEEEHASESGGEKYSNLTIQETIRAFILGFRSQSARYKIVWSVRILCWFLLFGLAVFGVILKARKYFR